jgi:uncharacterized membrane protein YhaH (DUF805 family)
MHYYSAVLKKYAVFDGRATRKEYWMFTLWNSIIYIVLATVVGIVVVHTNTRALLVIDGVYILSILLPSIGVTIRRLHDTGRSGWWMLINLVPIIGAIVLLVFFVQDSKLDNQYGPNPKGLLAPRPHI